MARIDGRTLTGSAGSLPVRCPSCGVASMALEYRAVIEREPTEGEIHANDLPGEVTVIVNIHSVEWWLVCNSCGRLDSR